ncbi:MAG: putative sulfate exporter family transporter [Chloroflexi bacterium]|nr:putative sulfate exporter family transporter [Chloroflexota bacterium]
MRIARKLETAFPAAGVGELLPGATLTLAVAVVSFGAWQALDGTLLNVSALLWAFLFSIVLSNTVPGLTSGRFVTGVNWSSFRLLRVAIALLGLTISASVWTKLGGIGVLAVLLNLGVAFVLGSLFCRYVLKMRAPLALLIGAGTGICGASAIAATGPALKARAEEMGASVAVITLFGLLAMIGYPVLFQGALGPWLSHSAAAFGMWAGMGIHETAQVLAASSQVDGALDVAMVAKSIRIFMIGPVVFASLFLFQRLSRAKGDETKQQVDIPWFALAFVILTVVHWILQTITPDWKALNSDYLKPTITFLLAWAFAGVGLKVKLLSIRQIGLKAFVGGLVVALMGGFSALLITKYLWLASL